jgi:hypothetical protein
MKRSKFIHNPGAYINLDGIKTQVLYDEEKVFYEKVYIQTKLNTENSNETEHEERIFSKTLLNMFNLINCNFNHMYMVPL